jgi:hypothetical protein
VPRNGQYALTIAHYDVLALTDNAKPGFLQRAYGVEMVYAGYLWQGLNDHFHFSDVRASELLVNH